MARFARIDSQIRANQAIGAKRPRVPKLPNFFCESRFGALHISNRSSNVTKICMGFPCELIARIDSREAPRFALRIAGPSKIRMPEI